MANHRQIVGRSFRIGALVLGVPSLAGLVAIGANLLLMPPAPDKSPYLAISKYGVTGLLANGGKALGVAFDGLGSIGVWFEKVLAAALVFAVILYFTGRGIARQSAGARAVGIALSVAFLLLWTLVLLSLSRSAMAVSALGMAAAAYAIWALGWAADR